MRPVVTLVWVRAIDTPFRVLESAEAIMQRARELGDDVDQAALPFLELPLEGGATAHVNPWAIEALQETHPRA